MADREHSAQVGMARHGMAWQAFQLRSSYAQQSTAGPVVLQPVVSKFISCLKAETLPRMLYFECPCNRHVVTRILSHLTKKASAINKKHVQLLTTWRQVL